MRPYTRHLAICGAANVIGDQPLRTWPGIPVVAAAVSGFLQVCCSGDKLRTAWNQDHPSQFFRVESISHGVERRPLGLPFLLAVLGARGRQTKRRAKTARACVGVR